MFQLPITLYALRNATRKSRARVAGLIFINFLLSILDFSASILLGLTMASIIDKHFFQSTESNNSLLNPIISRMNDISSATNLYFLFILAFVIVAKSIASIWLLKYSNNFLGLVRAEYSKRLFYCYLNSDYETTKRISSQDISYAVIDGSISLFFGILGSFLFMLADIFLIALMLILIIFVNLNLTIFLLTISIAFVLLNIKLTHKKLGKFSDSFRENTILSRSQIHDSFNLYKDIRVHTLSNRISDNLGLVFLNASKAQGNIAWIQQFPKYSYELLAYISTFLLFAFGYLSSEKGNFATSLSIFLAMLSRILPTSLRVQNYASAIKQNISGARHTIHISKLLFSNETNTIWDYKEADTNLLENTTVSNNLVKIAFNEVTFQYQDAQKPVLERVSFELHPFGVNVVVGRSGEGKSTFCDLLLGLLIPTSGGIEFTKEDSKPISRKELRIGYVPQNTYLFEGSIRENLTFSLRQKVRDEDLWEILKTVDLEELIRELPEGLDSNVGELGNFFSGGQKQRLAIAREVLTNPNLLILDEPTSAQDSQTQDKLLSLVKGLSKTCTIVVVAHRTQTLKIADQVILIVDRQVRILDEAEVKSFNSN